MNSIKTIHLFSQNMTGQILIPSSAWSGNGVKEKLNVDAMHRNVTKDGGKFK